MKQEIILIGGGGHCKSCIDIIEQEDNFVIAGIIDMPELIGKRILSYPIIGSDEKLEEIAGKYKFFLITLGHIKSGEKRKVLFQKIKELKAEFPLIISPIAYVSRYAEIGEGTIVMHNVVINAKARIGKNCIINTGAIIEHDAVIEDNCHISTGAVINGGAIVGKGSFVGSGSVTIESVRISEDSFIKANSLVKDQNE